MTQAILITGAAKRLGRVMSQYLARPDRVMILHYNRSGGDAESLCAELRDRTCPAFTLQADLSSLDAAQRLIADAQALCGHALTGLINSASVFDFDTPNDPSASIFATAQRVNLETPIHLSAEFARRCDPEKDNVIINILDQKLWNMNPDFFSYTCSKAGLQAATLMMDQAFGRRARACAIAPGLLFPSFDQTPAHFETVASRNILGTPIDPKNIAKAADFILNTPSFRRQVLHIDNGQRFYKTSRDIMFAAPVLDIADGLEDTAPTQ